MPNAATDKVIVTNRSALRRKYAAAGFRRIEQALARLVRADARRGVATQVVWLDERAAMRALGAPVVRKATSAAQNKRAIDGVFAATTPDYLMILGASDVVPHQPLRNPAVDEDRVVPSDLPYACDAPYGREMASFRGPTRVVGRLPDRLGARDPGGLVALLAVAARWRKSAPGRYGRGFVLSAEAWKGSSRASARRLFGSPTGVLLSPPAGPRFGARQLASSVHFLNCHGAEIDPAFYGDPGDPLPTALRSAHLPGVKEGTVVAAECCYGAELYDADAYGIEPGMCNAYLAKKVYGYLGSTTVAYGPPDGSGYADLLCIYFIEHVQQGASVGRAALEARLDFVRHYRRLGPIHLKTLAQFQLYGDPSVHPARRSGAQAPKAAKRAGAKPTPKAGTERRGRRSRRRALHRDGDRLGSRTPATLARPDRSRKAPGPGRIADVVAYLGLTAGPVRTFELRALPAAGTRKARPAAAAGAPRHARERFHVMVHRDRCRAGSGDGRTVRRHLAVVVHERDGRESFEVLISR